MSDNQQWTWQPAMDGVFVKSATPAGARITVAGSELQEVDFYGDVLDTYPLPDDLRLCRRVPAPDAPVDAIRWLMDRFGEDDPLLPYSPQGRALIQSIRDWLAQRTK